MSFRLLLIGCGNMGGALLARWLDQNLVQDVQIVDPSALEKDWPQAKIHTSSDTVDFTTVDLIVLAVKPQIMDTVCDELNGRLADDIPVLSIAAGKPLSYFAHHFGPQRPLIRVMPNTPAMIGEGMSVLSANEAVDTLLRDRLNTLFEASGQIAWLEDEDNMHTVTALSGSGPAYVFAFIEALAKAGQENGLDPQTATLLARQTVIGAAALAKDQSKISAETLRANVTSKGGTTEAGLAVLQDGGMEDILRQTLAAAAKRSRDLAG